MTKTPIDQCPAGAAMDAAVAEVLGWKRHSLIFTPGTEDPFGNEWYECTECGCGWSSPHHNYKSMLEKRWCGEYEYRTPPLYSTDIAQAWDLIESMRAESNDIQEEFIAALVPQRDRWRTENNLSIFEDMLFNVLRWLLWKADAPLAICRAFLKAHGVTEVNYE